MFDSHLNDTRCLRDKGHSVQSQSSSRSNLHQWLLQARVHALRSRSEVGWGYFHPNSYLSCLWKNRRIEIDKVQRRSGLLAFNIDLLFLLSILVALVHSILLSGVPEGGTGLCLGQLINLLGNLVYYSTEAIRWGVSPGLRASERKLVTGIVSFQSTFAGTIPIQFLLEVI